MECAKQLVDLVIEVYKPEMNVLDVGCAAEHYYNGIKRIDEEIKCQGADATTAYIQFAQKHFKNNQNTVVELADIFNLPKIYAKQFDIVICCNVILHLPSIQILLKNLLTATRRYCFIRMLIGKQTHLSRLLYSDSFDEHGEPTDFIFRIRIVSISLNTHSSSWRLFRDVHR